MPDSSYNYTIPTTSFAQAGSLSGSFSVVYEANFASGSIMVADSKGALLDLSNVMITKDPFFDVDNSTQITASDDAGNRLVLDISPDSQSITQATLFENNAVAGTASNAPVSEVTTCFCTGTLIATDRGEQPIETLRIGDRVATLYGTYRQIRWIGRQSYAGTFLIGRHLMLPICVKANAIAPGMPSRDLWVSPGHALFIDGQLVPAWRLVNGTSITQAASVDQVVYLHIELDRHDIIVANGLHAESFLDEDCRGQFHNAAEFHARYPDATAVAPLQPRLEDGFALRSLQDRIAAQAGIPTQVEPLGALRGFIDQASPRMVTGWAQDVDSPEEPVALEVTVGDEPVLCLLANVYRADLRRAGFGSGCHGFATELPDWASGPIAIRRITDGAILAQTEAAQRQAA
jgi:hypothetical protein